MAGEVKRSSGPSRPTRRTARGWAVYVITVGALTLLSWGTLSVAGSLGGIGALLAALFNGPQLLLVLWVSSGGEFGLATLLLTASAYWAVVCVWLMPLEFFERNFALQVLLLFLATCVHVGLLGVALHVMPGVLYWCAAGR